MNRAGAGARVRDGDIMASLVDRYASKINCVLSCLDRVLITGTLPEICHPAAMAAYLRSRRTRLFDYPRFWEPMRAELRAHAEQLAAAHGLKIEFIRKNNFRKEARVKEIVARRGDHPGLVHIFSAMEPCSSFRPWHDKSSGQTFFKPTESKCLHYYFYFIDEALGLCYLRVPTWAPFRLQFYFNGHHWLAQRLARHGIGHTLVDNVFTDIEDFAEAQRLADDLPVQRLHRRLDRIAATYCPMRCRFRKGYHWTLSQVEYATDLAFRNPEDLAPIYEALTRTAIHAVKPDHIATFLGRKLDPRYQDEIGNHFQTRILGTRLKHEMGRTAIKMYDKLGRVLRIETTTSDVTFFKHHRMVEHRDGDRSFELASMRKTIYSLPALCTLMNAANERYLAFLSTIDDPAIPLKQLDHIAETVRDGDRASRGFNLFHREDRSLFEALVRGEFQLKGFSNRLLRAVLPSTSAARISRLIKRLRLHGLVKRIGRTYRYYLTVLGQKTITAALTLRHTCLLPCYRPRTAA